MKTIKTFESFISEKKKNNTTTKIKAVTKKQKKAVKKVKKFLKKDKEIANDVKDGKADSSDKMRSMLFKLQAKGAKVDVQKTDLKKKELEVRSKLDTIRKSKKKEDE